MIKNNFGILKWKNGDMLKREQKDYKANAHGVIKYNNGDIFEGDFKNKERNAHGKIIIKDGNIFECEYKDGKCVDYKSIIGKPILEIVFQITLLKFVKIKNKYKKIKLLN